MNFKIVNDKKNIRRTNPKFIIICPVHNMMVKNTVYEPNIIIGSYKYTWGKLQEYFYRTVAMKQPPMHFFTEYLDEDYVTYIGTGISQQSIFLKELYRVGVIHAQYQNSIIIAVGEDYRLDTIDDRMNEHLCNFVISPLLREYGLSQYDNIKFIDEIIMPNGEEMIKNHPNPFRIFDLQKSKYFDKVYFLNFLKKYIKK